MSQSIRILLSLIGGLLAGIGLVAIAPDFAHRAILITQPVGLAWLHALQMVIVPLIVGLLITGIGAATDVARAGRLTMRAMLSFVIVLWSVTLMSALVTPLLLRVWPLPAAWANALQHSLAGAKPAENVPGLAAFFDSIVPTNVFAAAAGDAFLPLTVFSLTLAFAITRLPDEPRQLLTRFFQAITDAMLVIIHWVLRLAPIGVGALAYGVGARTGASAFGALLHYIVTVSSIGVIVLLSAYPVAMIGARVSLGRFAREVAPAQAMAISTQSSLASLPVMLEACTRLGAKQTNAGIVLPIAVAVFRATSPAMNLAVALYVAHLVGVPIGPGAMLAGICTAAITTMGSVSLPGTISYIASVAPVALAMGVPIEALGLLIAVETLPDIFRTVGNVTMDTAITTVLAREKEEPSAEAA